MPETPPKRNKLSPMETIYNISKVYLVRDTDYNNLRNNAGVPYGYNQLSICGDTTDVMQQIQAGINAGFVGDNLTDTCFLKNNHVHQFVRVPDDCNADPATILTNAAAAIIDTCLYELQANNNNPDFENPKTIGKSSYSIIFVNKLK